MRLFSTSHFDHTVIQIMLADLPISLIPENIYTPPQRKRRSVEEHASPTVITKNATEQNVIEQNATEQNVTEQNATEQNVIEQNATEQNVTEQNATEQNVIEQNATEQNVQSDVEEVVVPLNTQNIEHTLSLRELRQRCIDKGLNASGKKSELVSRLLAAQQ